MKSLERAAKRGLIRLAGPVFPARRQGTTLTRVLLVRVDDRLGNLIFLSPALDWLRRTRPEAKLGILASRAFAAIYAADPRVDQLHIVDKEQQKAFFPKFFQDLGRIAAARYDGVLDCSDRCAFSFNHSLYTRASRAPHRIGFATELAPYYLTRAVEPPAAAHAARDPLILAGALTGLEPPPLEECRLKLHLPPAAADWRQVLDQMTGGGPERIVGMHVGGRGAKRWPIPRYVDVASALLEAGYRPWVFRGPLEKDVVAAFTPMVERGLVLVPPADIVRVGQAMTRCHIVIAPDTGPMHLASAVGAGTLALFLDSDAEHYRPLGQHDRWIDARGKNLPADHVLRVALTMLQQVPVPEAS